MLRKMLAKIGGEEKLNAKDKAFIAAARNEGKVPRGVALSIAREWDHERYGQDRNNRIFDYAVDKFINEIGDKDIAEINRGDVAGWIAMNGTTPAVLR